MSLCRIITCADYHFYLFFAFFFQINRNSWPFKQPVDQNEVPKYYEVIKEPMGKEAVARIELNCRSKNAKVMSISPARMGAGQLKGQSLQCDAVFKTMVALHFLS